MFFKSWQLPIHFHCTEKSSNNILQNIYFYIQQKTFWITNNYFSFKNFSPKTKKWRTYLSSFLFVFGPCTMSIIDSRKIVCPWAFVSLNQYDEHCLSIVCFLSRVLHIPPCRAWCRTLCRSLMQARLIAFTDFECLGIHLLPCCHFKYLSYWSTCLKAAVSRRAVNVKGPSLFSCRVTLEASQHQQLHKP